MRDDVVMAKFRRLTSACPNASQAETALNATFALETMENLQDLFQALVVL